MSSCFDRNFCYECGNLLPLTKLQETILCSCCEEWKRRERKKAFKRMRKAEVEVEFDEDAVCRREISRCGKCAGGQGTVCQL
uniref:Uncharacterized protein n=1 Tax=Salmo trutta TaxID=8032 RepID=A0A673ZU73_SALTR